MLKQERSLYQKENTEDYSNGSRYRKTPEHDKMLELRVHSTHSDAFYTLLSAILRSQDVRHINCSTS